MLEDKIKLLDLFEEKVVGQVYRSSIGTFYRFINFEEADCDDYFEDKNSHWRPITELTLSPKTPKKKFVQHLKYLHSAGKIKNDKIKRLIPTYSVDSKIYYQIVDKKKEDFEKGDCFLVGGLLKKVESSYKFKNSMYPILRKIHNFIMMD